MNHMKNFSGVEEDPRQAEYWLLQGAAAGYAEAYRMLYHLYSEEGELHDAAKSFKWLERGADEGEDEECQLGLGQAYESGEQTDKDGVQALKWCYLAACQSPVTGPEVLEVVERLLGTMSHSEVEDAKQEATAWIQDNGQRRARFEALLSTRQDLSSLI